MSKKMCNAAMKIADAWSSRDIGASPPKPQPRLQGSLQVTCAYKDDGKGEAASHSQNATNTVDETIV